MKNRLINLHRAGLAQEYAPSEEELQAYFEAHRTDITVPEFRKVQMVMLNTEGEAQAILNVFGAIHEGRPTNDLIAIRYLKALEAIADEVTEEILRA